MYTLGMGEKKKDDRPRKNVRIPMPLLESVDAFAKAHYTSRSAVILLALMEYLERERKKQGRQA